jgi:4-hydroxybenzoate polyprenyltransferase
LLTRSQPARWIKQSLGLIDTYWGLIGTNWGRLLGNCGLGSLGFSCYFMSGG